MSVVAEFEQALTAGHYEQAIAWLKQQVAKDRRILTEPAVKAWLGRRWRNLFVQAASQDKAAVRASRRIGLMGRDKRSPQQKVAERFLLQALPSDWDSRLPPGPTRAPEATLVFCPGFINGLLPVHAFADSFQQLQDAQGWHIVSADAHPVRDCASNVEDLHTAVVQGYGYWPSPKHAKQRRAMQDSVILLGYSKGSPDILHLLAEHPELKDRVKAVFTWAGAMGGSFSADKIYESVRSLPVQELPKRLHDLLMLLTFGQAQQGAFRRLQEYDVLGGIRALTTTEREAFLAEQGTLLDSLNVPFFNVTAATRLLEVPTIQMADWRALSAYCPDNDMQVTQAQAKLDLPMATHVATLHGHHWDVAYPAFPRALRLASPNLDHPFPRTAAMMACGQLCMELGLA